MTSLRIEPTYEDDLYYPVWVGGKLVEMLGKNMKNPVYVTLTLEEYNDILNRLRRLELESPVEF